MLLTLSDIEKAYPGADGPVPVLRGVSLTLDAGESLSLTGESGSGKSTLLHLVAGLEAPDAGTIRVADAEVGGLDDTGRARLRRETVAVVFQQFNLIPSLDADANIAFQARLAGRHDADWAGHLTERLGLDGHGHKYPEALSGGQQQRVAIGRALAARPRLLLADEPTGNLDEETGDRVLALMLDLAREAGAGILMVTHSPRLAARTDRSLALSRGRIA